MSWNRVYFYLVVCAYINTMKTTLLFNFISDKLYSNYKFTSKQSVAVTWQFLFVSVLYVNPISMLVISKPARNKKLKTNYILIYTTTNVQKQYIEPIHGSTDLTVWAWNKASKYGQCWIRPNEKNVKDIELFFWYKKCLFLQVSQLLLISMKCASHFCRQTANENKQFKETKTWISKSWLIR